MPFSCPAGRSQDTNTAASLFSFLVVFGQCASHWPKPTRDQKSRTVITSSLRPASGVGGISWGQSRNYTACKWWSHLTPPRKLSHTTRNCLFLRLWKRNGKDKHGSGESSWELFPKFKTQKSKFEGRKWQWQ